MFGDNQSVITSSTIPHSNLNKRHNALSYHRVREAISAKVMYFIHIDGKLNPSDVMTKFLGYAKFWPLIQPFLFWKGETIKGTSESTPMTQVISMIKDQSPSGLRGVTRGNGNDVSLSGNISTSASGEVNMSASGMVIPTMTQVPNPSGEISTKANLSKEPTGPLSDPPIGLNKLGLTKEGPTKEGLTKDLGVNSSHWNIDNSHWNIVSGRNSTESLHTSNDWITVPGRKSTQKLDTSKHWMKDSSSKSTQELHTMNAPVDLGTNKVS